MKGIEITRTVEKVFLIKKLSRYLTFDPTSLKKPLSTWNETLLCVLQPYPISSTLKYLQFKKLTIKWSKVGQKSPKNCNFDSPYLRSCTIPATNICTGMIS